MRYLFFDIECCDGKNICSFGYVATDSEFNVLKKEDIIINPEAEFKLSRGGSASNIKLAYDEEVFFKAKPFPFYYETIKDILTDGDQIVCGHAVTNDANFLKTACARYKLPQLSYYFTDSQKIYSQLGAKISFSLEKISENLKIEPQILHKSDDDAYLTMLVVRKLCEILKMSLRELIDICPSVKSSTQDGITKKSNASSYRAFKRLAKELKTENGNMNGVKVAFSETLEKNDTIKTWAMIREVARRGGEYTNLADTANVFVKEKDADCKRLRSAINGKAKIVDEIEFSKELGFDFSSFVFENVIPKRINNKVGITLGEMLKQQGIDLSAEFYNDSDE